MRKKALICDKCGKEIIVDVPAYVSCDVSARIDFYNLGAPRTRPQRMDLCAECAGRFIEFLEGGE